MGKLIIIEPKYQINFVNKDGQQVEWGVKFHSRAAAERALRFVKRVHALNDQAEIV